MSSAEYVAPPDEHCGCGGNVVCWTCNPPHPWEEAPTAGTGECISREMFEQAEQEAKDHTWGDASDLRDAEYERQFDHWNYRVLKRTAMTSAGEDQSFELIEAYYDKYGRIDAWCPATPGGSALPELEEDLRLMTMAAGLAQLKSDKRRVLTLADLPSEVEDEPEHIDGSPDV